MIVKNRKAPELIKDKIAPFAKHIVEGGDFLDFGCNDACIKEFVIQHGMNYFGHDINPIYKDNVEPEGKYLDIDNLMTAVEQGQRFDVIYMSSVVHEIISKYQQHIRDEELSRTFTFIYLTEIILDKMLKPNGKLIIRDWAYINDKTKVELFVRDKYNPVFADMLLKYKHMKELAFLRYDNEFRLIGIDTSNNGYLVTKPFAYNMIYHLFVGLEMKELVENYTCVNKADLIKYAGKKYEVEEQYCYEYTSQYYKNLFKEHFVNYKELITFFPSKQVIVLRKKSY